MTLTKHVFVEKADIRTQDEKNFFGIAPGKLIRLKYGPALKITSVTKAGHSFDVKAERITEEEAAKTTIKGVLNWVSKEDALKCEFRLYTKLFSVEKPTLDAKDPEGRKKELSPDSVSVCQNAVINKHMTKSLTKDSRYQFERLGFFSVDYDTNIEKGKYVFNRILETQTKKK
jgi:glutaminyl-tRNA synthetase